MDLIDWNHHPYQTTIGLEKKINTFLRLDNVSIREKIGMTNASRKEVFIKLRELRNIW